MNFITASAVIDDVTSRITLTLVALFVAALIVGVIIAAFVISSRNQTKKSKGKSTLPRHNYARFDRADARDYIPFDDILDVSEEHFGVLVDQNQSRFVCYIALQGFDYNLATKEEQYSAAMGMISVINTIDSTIQVRQDARPSDFSIAIAECDKIIKETEEKMEQVKIRGKNIYYKMQQTSQMENSIDKEAQMEEYYLRLQQEQNELAALNWIVQEQQAIKLQYQKKVDITAETNARKETLYIIDYYYNPADHMNRELSMSERYDEAIQKLWSKSRAYISALSKAGVYARRLSGAEILETLRFHTHPYSTAQSKTSDLKKAFSFKNLITTSDFPETMREEVEKERREQEERQRQLEEFYEQVGGYIPDDAPETIPAISDQDPEELIEVIDEEGELEPERAGE